MNRAKPHWTPTRHSPLHLPPRNGSAVRRRYSLHFPIRIKHIVTVVQRANKLIMTIDTISLPLSGVYPAMDWYLRTVTIQLIVKSAVGESNPMNNIISVLAPSTKAMMGHTRYVLIVGTKRGSSTPVRLHLVREFG